MERRWADRIRRLLAEREKLPPEMRDLGDYGLDALIDQEIVRLKAELANEEAPEYLGRREGDLNPARPKQPKDSR